MSKNLILLLPQDREMNQIQKRLKIINLAISITDIETIQLQVMKLNQIKSDINLQEILHSIQNKNYAKAQTLITSYLQQPVQDDVIQRVEEENKEVDLNLFVNEEEQPKPEIQLEDMFKIHKEKTSVSKKPIDEFDTLLNINHEDILKDNINIEQLSLEKKDNQEELSTSTSKSDNTNTYPNIPYIKDKYNNLQQQYPPIENNFQEYHSVQNWIHTIKTKGYTEEHIEEMIEYIYKLQHKNSAEAAQLLLVTASTQSLYAYFILARELYRGKLLQQNINESFKIIYNLATNENYPEAICDLAQFYEYGVGVKKDTKQALKLYDEAMQLGITRAMRNYDRLSKQKKSLFGLF